MYIEYIALSDTTALQQTKMPTTAADKLTEFPVYALAQPSNLTDRSLCTASHYYRPLQLR